MSRITARIRYSFSALSGCWKAPNSPDKMPWAAGSTSDTLSLRRGHACVCMCVCQRAQTLLHEVGPAREAAVQVILNGVQLTKLGMGACGDKEKRPKAFLNVPTPCKCEVFWPSAHACDHTCMGMAQLWTAQLATPRG